MIWVIVAMTVATYPVRLLPASFLKRIHISKAAKHAMQIMPFCIMVSMIVIDIATGVLVIQKFIAIALVLIISYVINNVGLSVLIGVIGYSVMFL